jgi:hypothetical protein
MGFYGRLLCSGSRAFKPNCPTMVLWQSIARALMLLAEPRVGNPPRCSPRRIWRSLYSPSAGDDADRRGCGRADIDVAEPEREPTPVERPRPSARRRKLCEHGTPSRAIAAATAPAFLVPSPSDASAFDVAPNGVPLPPQRSTIIAEISASATTAPATRASPWNHHMFIRRRRRRMWYSTTSPGTTGFRNFALSMVMK